MCKLNKTGIIFSLDWNIMLCKSTLGVQHLKINKLTPVFYASVLLLMINCVITLSKLWNHESQASGSAVNFDNVMTKFIFNNRTDA